MNPNTLTVPVTHAGPLRSIKLDYGGMIDAIRDVRHLSPEQIACLAQILASRLKQQDNHHLAQLTHYCTALLCDRIKP